jgi:hypothetical protein
MPSLGETRYLNWVAGVKTRGGTVVRWPITPAKDKEAGRYYGQLAARFPLSVQEMKAAGVTQPWKYELAPVTVRDWDNSRRATENFVATKIGPAAAAAESAAKGVLAAPRRLLAGVFGISEGTVTLLALGVAGWWIYKTFLKGGGSDG